MFFDVLAQNTLGQMIAEMLRWRAKHCDAARCDEIRHGILRNMGKAANMLRLPRCLAERHEKHVFACPPVDVAVLDANGR